MKNYGREFCRVGCFLPTVAHVLITGGNKELFQDFSPPMSPCCCGPVALARLLWPGCSGPVALARLLWPGVNWTPSNSLQKGFSQNILHGSEGARRLERGPGTECFIISNVAFPEVRSKVSELREPGAGERSTPLWPLGAKQLSTFLFSPSAWITCSDTVELFIWLDFFARLLESVGFLSLKGARSSWQD